MIPQKQKVENDSPGVENCESMPKMGWLGLPCLAWLSLALLPLPLGLTWTQMNHDRD